MQLEQNTLFDGRYFLKKLLGRGGFSEVWLVEDTKVENKTMVIKVYAPNTGLDDDGARLFSREFSLVFDLNHTNLLRPAHWQSHISNARTRPSKTTCILYFVFPTY